jgi:hypothetical protein
MLSASVANDENIHGFPEKLKDQISTFLTAQTVD